VIFGGLLVATVKLFVGVVPPFYVAIKELEERSSLAQRAARRPG